MKSSLSKTDNSVFTNSQKSYLFTVHLNEFYIVIIFTILQWSNKHSQSRRDFVQKSYQTPTFCTFCIIINPALDSQLYHADNSDYHTRTQPSHHCSHMNTYYPQSMSSCVSLSDQHNNAYQTQSLRFRKNKMLLYNCL